MWCVHLEVRLRSLWNLMPPHNSSITPASVCTSFPFSMTESASLVARETGFFPCDVETRGEGMVALFHPVMKDSPYACLIGRLMVQDPTLEPIYHSLIMFNGASDTSVLPVLSCGAAPTAGTFAVVADECS